MTFPAGQIIRDIILYDILAEKKRKNVDDFIRWNVQ